VIATRERLVSDLVALGFEVLPSKANFVFASHGKTAAVELAQALRDRAIIVRHFDHERTENYLRITVGTDNEVDRLITELKEILV
jgi:histidinol-phosphate aminotransferase